jgi:hypothetical protein
MAAQQAAVATDMRIICDHSFRLCLYEVSLSRGQGNGLSGDSSNVSAVEHDEQSIANAHTTDDRATACLGAPLWVLVPTLASYARQRRHVERMRRD